jgi:hypothetical protein
MAVAGLQATLRGNADVSRQRSEALRIAQETVENLRSFSEVETNALLFDYTDIVDSGGPVAYSSSGTAYAGALNTSFRRTITVPASPVLSSRLKTFTVKVEWEDRSGATQLVSMNGAIAGAAPELGGLTAMPTTGNPLLPVNGRNASIPPGAVNMTGSSAGSSAFVPPQQTGSDTYAWKFDNRTGLVTSVCTVIAGSTSADAALSGLASGCTTLTAAQLITGYVRFAAPSPDAAQAEKPTGTGVGPVGVLNLDAVMTLTVPSSTPPAWAGCYDDAKELAGSPSDPNSPATPGYTVTYYCLFAANSTRAFTGRLRLKAMPVASVSTWTISGGSTSTEYEVCRYTTLPGDTGTTSQNSQHPLVYTKTDSSPLSTLVNQNFLVIRSVDTCPTDTRGTFVNASTRLHQNGVSPTDNPP